MGDPEGARQTRYRGAWRLQRASCSGGSTRPQTPLDGAASGAYIGEREAPLARVARCRMQCGRRLPGGVIRCGLRLSRGCSLAW
jgi:hypothetical protein